MFIDKASSVYSVFVRTAGLNTLIMIPAVSLVGVGADSCCFCLCVAFKGAAEVQF